MQFHTATIKVAYSESYDFPIFELTFPRTVMNPPASPTCLFPLIVAKVVPFGMLKYHYRRTKDHCNCASIFNRIRVRRTSKTVVVEVVNTVPLEVELEAVVVAGAGVVVFMLVLFFVWRTWFSVLVLVRQSV